MSDTYGKGERVPAAKSAGHGTAMKFTIEEFDQKRTLSIKVIGIGGCGGNVLDTLIENQIGGVDYIAINTDAQALENCSAPTTQQIGARVTQGYGTGSDPEVGRQSALENTEELTELLGSADMVFLITGLGGGTGTGASPVVASLAKQMGVLTVGIAITPFGFEGKRRSNAAEEGLEVLVEQVDTAVVVPNERLLEHVESGTGFFDGFLVAHNIVAESLVGITGLLTKKGVMNTDFADVRAVFQDAGLAVVGTGQCSGKDAALEACREALASPVMEQEGFVNARKILVNITGSEQFGMHDAAEALMLIQREVSSESELLVGVVHDRNMEDTVSVMIVASGFSPRRFELKQQEDPQTDAESASSLAGAWRSERAVELVTTDVPRLVPEGVESGVPAESAEQPREGEAADHGPTNGHPGDYMPPPNLHLEDEDGRDGAAKGSFFGRRRFFR